jgi:hypothetical protein
MFSGERDATDVPEIGCVAKGRCDLYVSVLPDKKNELTLNLNFYCCCDVNKQTILT